jgi:hypothetical protein
MTVQDVATISQTGLTIAEGLAKLRVLRQNPLVGSEPPKTTQSEGQSDTKYGQELPLFGPPPRGPGILKLCI